MAETQQPLQGAEGARQPDAAKALGGKLRLELS
jgi:hypothetical protein